MPRGARGARASGPSEKPGHSKAVPGGTRSPDGSRHAGGTETRAVGRYMYAMRWIEKELAEKKREQVSDLVIQFNVNKEEEREEKEKKTRKNKDFHFLLFDI